MFGSNPFGQPGTSPFGAQPSFGQQNTATNYPFAARPFASTSPFGAATPSPSPLATPAFGASSAPAFGSNSSPFGASAFGQKPAFGGFGSPSAAQSSPSGSDFGQTQPTFGSQPFGATSQLALGSTSNPASGATSNPAFGFSKYSSSSQLANAFDATSTPAFGSSPSAFAGSVFGQNPAFGGFGSPSASQSSPFGSNFGQTQPAFGSKSNSAFGATSNPACGFSKYSLSSQSANAYDAVPTPAFGSSPSAFDFGRTPFGGQHGGNRVAPYTTTNETDSGSSVSGQMTRLGKLLSISAMRQYKEKSHEELRWEDYQSSDKGGPNPGTQQLAGSLFSQPTQSSPFGHTTSSPSAFGQTTPSPSTTPAFGGTSSASPFGTSSSPAFGLTPFGQASQPASLFGSTPSLASSPKFGSSTPFGNTQSSGQSMAVFSQSQPAFGQLQPAFGQSAPAFDQSAPSAFGQTTPSPSTTPVFGGASSASPFGTSNSPAFGSTPFGQASQPASLIGSTPSLASSPAFGSSAPFGNTQSSGQSMPDFSQYQPAFGQSHPAFGQSAPAFGQSAPSAFGQTTPSPSTTPAFRGASSASPFGTSSSPAFGSTPFGQASQPASLFGSTPLASSPAFGSSTPFGNTQSSDQSMVVFSQSQPAFGQSAPSAFGQTTPSPSTTPAFGGTSCASPFGTSSSPAFGSTPFGQASQPVSLFGSTPSLASSPAFGSSTPFGNTQSSGQSMPAFSQFQSAFGQSQPAFGQSAPAFGQSAPSAFGQTTPSPSTTPAFGGTFSASPFGTSSSPAFGSTPFGQASQPASLFGSTSSLASSPAFGSSTPFGNTQSSGQCMPAFSQFQSAFGQSQPAFGQSVPAFGQSTPSAFAQTTPSPSTTPAFGGASSASPFGTSISPAVGATPFGQASQPASLFGSTPSLGPIPAFESSTPFANTQSSSQSMPAFDQSQPAFGQSQPAFGQSAPVFGQSTPAFDQSTPAFGQSQPAFGQSQPAFGHSTPAFGQFTPVLGQNTSTFEQTANAFGQTIPAFGSNLFSNSTTSMMSQSKPAGLKQSTPSLFGGFQNPTPTQTQDGVFSLGNFCQPQAAVASSGFGAAPTPAFGQTTFGQPAQQNVMVMTPQPVYNPFGTLPPMPRMSIGQSAGSTPSIQYGISSMPVNEKPTQARSSLLHPRYIALRSRIHMHSRRYNSKKDGPMVSLFSDALELPSNQKADAMFFIPMKNPRALFIRQPEQSSPSMVCKPAVNLKEMAVPINDHGTVGQDSYGTRLFENDEFAQEPENAKENWPGGVEDANIQNNIVFSKLVDGPVKSSSRQNGSREEHNHRGNGYISFSGHRAGEAAIVHEHGADIEPLMPKLRHSDYYTEPKIQELAAKERAEPGYCRWVKDFVVGRKGYGSIKFFGVTDVRWLDLESIIQFNKCEVLVYPDESRKPPPGQGLNKPAEITLLNVICVDERTGQHCTEGVAVDRYEKWLKSESEEQGAKFISYNAIKGEWKFRVKHFSKCALDESGFWKMWRNLRECSEYLKSKMWNYMPLKRHTTYLSY